MSTGKPLKKNFYSGGTQDIEMPPLDESPPITQAQDPWSNHPKNDKSAISVPDELPEEIVEGIEDSEIEGAENEQESSFEDKELPQSQRKSSLQDKVVAGKTKEENFKTIREAKERAERERDLLLEKMIEMQKLQQQYQQPQQKQQVIEEEPDDFDLSVEDDALIEGKHAKKLVAQMKKMQQKLESYQSHSYQASVESKIKSSFPDFEEVVSQENVQILNQEYPELAASLRDTSDMYNKAAAAYKVIKGMGIYKDRSEFMKERDKAIKNSQKPRPVASVNPQQGDSPLSKANAFANGLTPELQKQLREEMFRVRKNH